MKTLVIDASTPTLFMGVFEDAAWLTLQDKQANAMEGLFTLAEKVFEEVPLSSIERIAICEGPGRLMSLRIAAVAANQWAGEKAAKFTYNAIQVVSSFLGAPVAYEVRANTFALWKNNKMEMTDVLPVGATLLGSSVTQIQEIRIYSEALKLLPTLSERVFKPTEFFDPPIFVETNYVLATNKIVSKEG